MQDSLCSSCGAPFHTDATFCSRCGAPRPGAAAPVAASESYDSAGKDFELTCGALGLFVRWIALTITVFLIVPAPWAICWYMGWLVENVRGRHGSKLAFHGTPASVWVLTTLYGALTIGGIAWSVWIAANEDPGPWADAGFQIANNLASIVLGYFFFRWMIGNTDFAGNRLTLTAGLGKYFGWMVLFMLSFFTIIGWAWVACALYRWLAGTVEGAPGRFTFVARGHQMLGRTLLALLFSIPVVTLPWAIRWYFGWYIEQFRYQEAG